MSMSDAKKIIASCGCVLSKEGSEYRVNLKGGREETAYYTDDLQDAVGTAIAMRDFN